jgi:lipopolysaccharide transport system ATP-binding protein
LESENKLRLDGVSKKFRKGELFDSLRDALPALAAKLLRRPNRSTPSAREFWALEDISFSVGRGEVLGIIGHNGAGKSTILKLLSGLMKPTSGTIDVNGSLSALIEVGAGFHPDLTGRENIYLNGAILGLSRGEITRKFDQIVEFSGLSEFLDTPVKRYSTGMYARLGFSVAAHVDSEILLCDEVLSVGDYLFRKRCMERMQEIVDGGSAIIFVSHDLDAISRFCTRAILLDRGRIVARGIPKDVITAYFEAGQTHFGDLSKKQAFVSRVLIRGEDGPRSSFRAGEDAWLDVDVTANQRSEALSLSVYLRDRRNIDIFYASMVRLGLPPVALDAGETRTFTVHLKLHLAGGAFLVGVAVSSYSREVHAREDSGSDPGPFKIHDDRFPLGTLLIESPLDVGTMANLYPEIRVDAAPHTNGFRKLPALPGLEVECRPGNQGLTPQLTGSPGDGSASHSGDASKRASET